MSSSMVSAQPPKKALRTTLKLMGSPKSQVWAKSESTKVMPGMSQLLKLTRWVSHDESSALMYNHRTEKTRVDVVDLDPYGTAAPFIDGAVQAINDGGESIVVMNSRLLKSLIPRLAMCDLH
jgi:hypothetical protein